MATKKTTPEQDVEPEVEPDVEPDKPRDALDYIREQRGEAG